MAGEYDDPAADTDDPGVDAIHRLLSSRRRRYVIADLLADGQLSLEALARRVVAREYDRDPADVPVEVRQKTYLDLYHTHVPKLRDHGVVEYCEEEGLVCLVDTDDALETHLATSLATETDRQDE